MYIPLKYQNQTIAQRIEKHRNDIKELTEKKYLLAVGQKGTNIEVQIDKTIKHLQEALKNISKYQKVSR